MDSDKISLDIAWSPYSGFMARKNGTKNENADANLARAF